MSELINQSQVKNKRQKLRNNLTKPEEVLWYYIRKRQILGIKFRRQCSIGKYIVDFYSFEKKLAIEIDGDSHFESKEAEKHDKDRTKFIESQGIQVIRFFNTDIMKNIEGCIEVLKGSLNRE